MQQLIVPVHSTLYKCVYIGFQKELGISSFSVQENRMEDVFIKVGEGQHQSWLET